MKRATGGSLERKTYDNEWCDHLRREFLSCVQHSSLTAAHASPRAHLRRFPSFGKDHIEAQPYTYARDCFNKFGWLRLDEDWG
jgi:hypothetical protein